MPPMRSRPIAVLVVAAALALWARLGHNWQTRQPDTANATGRAQANQPSPLQPSHLLPTDGTRQPSRQSVSGQTRFVDAYRALDGLAAAGDAAASTKLFDDALQCERALDTEELSAFMDKSGWSDAERARYEKLEPQARAAHLRDLEQLAQRLKDARALRPFCTGFRDAIDGPSLYALTYRAAEHGSIEAAVCYVAGSLYFPQEQQTAEQMETYTRNAQQMLRVGLEAGSWEMVALGVVTSQPARRGDGMRGQISHDLPLQKYRYTKLLRHGANETYAKQLDQQLTTLANQLDPAAVREADQWADDSYRRYFPSNKNLSDFPKICP